jgi:hypothetical protein
MHKLFLKPVFSDLLNLTEVPSAGRSPGKTGFERAGSTISDRKRAEYAARIHVKEGRNEVE